MEHQELKDQWDQPEIMVLNKLNWIAHVVELVELINFFLNRCWW
jgi:hypothetical protein